MRRSFEIPGSLVPVTYDPRPLGLSLATDRPQWSDSLALHGVEALPLRSTPALAMVAR